MEQPVKDEKTFWRDMDLLLEHRKWGWDVPATDIDFLEYDNKKAIALIEYKRRDDPAIANPTINSNAEALIDLGTRAMVPVFYVFYDHNRTKFHICPINELGKLYNPPDKLLTKQEYVNFLYEIRDRVMPKHIQEKFL